MTDDLIARLRRGVPFRQTAVLPDTAVGTAFAEPDLHSVVQTMVEAADRLAHLEAEVARLTKERDEAYERAAKVADAVESPFDEHSHAPENCAFYDAVEACAQAIRNLKEQP